MIVQDLVNALLQFPPTMEVYTVREDFSKTVERYAPVDIVTIGEAMISQDKDKDGNEKSISKQAILIKGLTVKKENV